MLIIGGGRVGSELAWYLSDKGVDVTLADVLEEVELLPEEHPTNRAKLLHSVKDSGVRTLFDSKLEKVEDGLARFDMDGRIEEVAFNDLVVSVGMKPRNSLSNELKDEGDIGSLTIYEIGDCVEPADFYEAIHDGHKIGLEV